MFNGAFIADLDQLLAKHNILRSQGRTGQLILTDPTGAEDEGKREFKYYARHYGLEPEDHGATVSVAGRRFKVIGIKTNRPKYPFVIEDLGNGKVYKGQFALVSQIVQARAQHQAKQARDMSAAPSQPADQGIPDYADLAQF